MKLTRVLKITETEFYDFLENNLLSNIYKDTGNKLSVKDIKKGLKYIRNENDAITRVEVSILDYKRGSFYKSKTKSIANTITISFETEVVEEGLKIIFNQHIKSFEEKKFNKFFRMFSEAVYLGRMTDTLYNIQNKINTGAKEAVENISV